MKILVLSDSHGNARGVENAVKKYGRNADLIVHCGDATRGEAEDLARKSDMKKRARHSFSLVTPISLPTKPSAACV